MMSPLAIIDKYYPHCDELRYTLLVHSWQVAIKALRCASHHPELKLDKSLVLRGALLHDVGVFLTHAPSIHCYGEQHYLMHGFAGAQILRELNMEAEARICERHTGAGLTANAIKSAGLNVEIKDYLPQTIEEQLICYADKFYSKSKLNQILNYEQAYNSLLKFGPDGAERFHVWHLMFG